MNEWHGIRQINSESRQTHALRMFYHWPKLYEPYIARWMCCGSDRNSLNTISSQYAPEIGIETKWKTIFFLSLVGVNGKGCVYIWYIFIFVYCCYIHSDSTQRRWLSVGVLLFFPSILGRFSFGWSNHWIVDCSSNFAPLDDILSENMELSIDVNGRFFFFKYFTKIVVCVRV